MVHWNSAKCQSSLFLVSYWSRVYHVNVKKFDCFPSDKSRRATVCCGPGNNKTGSHVTEKISKPETKIHHIIARVCKIHSLLLLYIKNSSLFLYFFVLFDTWYDNKALIYWNLGKAVCFVVPRPLMFPSAPLRETSAVSGPQNILFPSVPVNKC